MRRTSRNPRIRELRVLGRVLAAVGTVALILGLIALWQAAHVPPPSPTGSVEMTYEGSIGSDETSPLVQPVGIAVDGAHVYVSDARRKEIVVFTPDGMQVGSFGKGRLKTPLYLARDPLDGRLYVTDRSANSVLVFTASGQYLRSLSPKLAPNGTPLKKWQPIGIGFAPNGTGYVTDVSSPQRVLKLSADGSVASVVGTGAPPGTAGNPLSYPNGVAASDSGAVISDSNNARLLFVSSDGAYEHSTLTGGLPRGVALVPGPQGGLVVVVDTIGGDLKVYGENGQLAGTAGSPGSAPGQFRYPTAVAAGAGGLLYVTDTGNRRVEVWRLGAAGAAASEERARARTIAWVALAVAATAWLISGSIWLYLRRSLPRAV